MFSTGQKQAGFVLGITTAGLALRLLGIDWGLPRIDLNPDELNVLQITERISWSHLDPGFYNYSGLTFHLNFLAGELSRLFGLPGSSPNQLLVNRLLAVLLGTLAIPVTFLAAKRLVGSARIATLTAVFMALLPLNVWDAHFATSDMGLVLWTVVAFYLAVGAAKQQDLASYALGGIAVGLAIATKFNGAIAGATFIAAAVIGITAGRVAWRMAMRNLIVAGGIALLTFAIASPFSILHLSETLQAFRFESHHVTAGHYGFDLDAAGWQYHHGIYQLVAAFPFSLGFALYGAVLVGIFVFIRRRTWSQRALLLTFPTVYLGVTMSWSFVPIRYYLPVLPMLTIMAADGFDRALSSKARLPRLATLGALALVLVYTFVFTATSTWRFTKDTRIQAGEWIERELPGHSRIVFVESGFGHSYMPIFERDDVRVRRTSIAGARSLRPFLWESEGDGLLIATGLTFRRAYRQGDPDVVADWDLLRANPKRFELVRRFSSWYLHKQLYVALDPMYDGYFVSPTIELYRPIRAKNARTRQAPEIDGGF